MNPDSPAFEFLLHLIQRAGVKRIICVGGNAAKHLLSIKPNLEIVQFGPSAGSPEWLRPEEDESPPIRFIEADLEQSFVIDQALLEDAIVVCLDVLDQLQNPDPLINTLAHARRHCKFMLITVADRVRTAGFTFSESSENARSHLKWSAEEFFQALVKAGFPQSMLFGFTSNSAGVDPKNSILVIAGREAEPNVVPGDFRVAAIINLFNEIDIIETTVRYLADQGIEVHLFDNWSNDGSFELCQRLLEQKLVKSILRFPVQKTNDYEWAKQLENTAEYAAQLDVNWAIHYDADEIRCSPWQNLNLFEAIKFVDSLDYTAIDFTVLDFRFTADNDIKNFSLDEFKLFEFGRHQANFTQIKAWKNWHQLIELAESGGHEAVFAQRRVYPLKFLTKHFSLRSIKQASKKIFHDRLPRIIKERVERGWHVHFDQYKYLHSIEPWKPYELTIYDETTFQFDFIVERLSGVGVRREDHTSLNRNSAKNLGGLLEEMAGRLASSNQTVAEHQRLMEEMAGRLASSNQTVAESDVANWSLLHSRSWRLTAPLRVLGTLARRISEPGARCGLFSRAVMAICVLPATFFHYRNPRDWATATTRGASFFGAVLNNPTVSRKRLAGMPRLVRVPVWMGISMAIRIRKNGGVLPSARNLGRVFATEGVRGVYVRMMDRVPVRDVVVANAPVNLRRILLADYRIPMQDVSSGERGTVGILRDLCSFGYEVVFLPNDLAPSPKYEAELHALGVTVITSAQGYYYPIQYLRAQGHTFGAFHLFRLDVAEAMLDVVKLVAPAARVIFHTVDLHFLREKREAELHGNNAGFALSLIHI
jgi:hypothetical protein